VAWVIPSLVYVVAIGAFGVTGKLALRTYSWQELIVWTAFGYAAFAGLMLALGQAEVRVVRGIPWVLLSAVLPPLALIAFYVALGHGKAGTVTAVSAAYPAVTLVLAAAFLAEGLSLVRVAGAVLVVGGVVVLALAK
jgi:transporter family protein